MVTKIKIILLVFLITPQISMAYIHSDSGSRYQYYFGSVIIATGEIVPNRVVAFAKTGGECVGINSMYPRLITGGGWYLDIPKALINTSCTSGVRRAVYAYSSIDTRCTNPTGEYVSACSGYEASKTTPPEHCYNGVKDSNEDGIDCGSVCLNDCKAYWVCPDGYSRTLNVGSGEETCTKYTPTDKIGNCPNGTTKVVGSDANGNKITHCKHPQVEPEAVFTAPHIASDWDNNPNPVIAKPEWQGETPEDKNFYGVSVTEMVYPKETVSVTDNGDGTTTTVTKDTKVRNHGDGTTTTTTTITTTVTDNATGEKISEGKETKIESDDPTGNAANYAESPGIDGGTTNDHGRFSERVGAFVDAVRGAPIFDAFSAVLGGPSGSGSPVLFFNFGSYGVAQVDMSQYASALEMVGYALITVALYVAARLLIANK